jgi:RNA polymerase sigma factor (sigma-70 family)
MTRMDQGDDRLAQLAAGGDPAAFAQLYERHHRALYRYCLSILRDAEDARDALQSTMEKALRSMPSQRVKGGLRAWLFTIAHNESISLAARRQPPADESPGAGLTAADASTRAAERERLRQLVRDLARLPERQRGALLMREMSGLSYEEVAAALGMSPRVARQTVYEARMALLELGEGRDMGCDRVRRKISAGDGRVLRGRTVRAHLSECAGCTAFQAGIVGRTGDYALLFPALPAVAAAALLEGVSGGAGAGASAAPGAGAGGVGEPAERGANTGRALAALAVAGLIFAGALGSLFGGEESSRLPAAATPGEPPAAEASTPAPEPLDAPIEPEGVRRGASVEGYSQLPGAVLDAMDERGGAGGTQGSAGRGGDGGLAFTGLDVWPVALLGLGFLALGASLRELARTRS